MIICCGESLIDMIPIEIKDNEILYSPLTGGAIFNTSIALGRLNVSVGLLSGVSTDLFGEKLISDLIYSNVNVDYLIRNLDQLLLHLLRSKMDMQSIHSTMSVLLEIVYV